MKRCIFSNMLILFIFTNMSRSQITIESNEYNIDIGTKHFLYSSEDTVGDGFDVNVGSAGGPQTWTFTLEQFPNGYTNEFTVVDPTSTPFHGYLPESNNVWYVYYPEDSASIYQYFTLTGDALYRDAMIINHGDSSVIMAPEPSEKIISFPAHLGINWTNNYEEEYIFGDFGLIDSTSSVSTIDAWGTINIPAGSFDCLRVREEKTSFLTVFFFGIPIPGDTTTSISYMWIGKKYGILAGITSDTNETDLSFTKAIDVTLRSNIETAIADNKPYDIRTFRLYQNYPNPFNSVTTITYNLTQPSHVELIIYNTLGQEIATIVKEFQSPGFKQIKWDAGNNPSGIYLFYLTCGKESDIRKMVLIK
jgi:hypothetical protein